MRLAYSNGYRQTEDAMRSLSWNYRDRTWAQVPFDEKGDVYDAYCTETKNDNDEDVFFNKMTRRSYGSLFSQVKKSGGLEYVDRDDLNSILKNLMIEVAMRADPLLEIMFEEQKPSKDDLKQAARDEMEDVMYGHG